MNHLAASRDICDMDAASQGYYASEVDEVVRELEAENKKLRADLETANEALAGAHRVIRHQRDKDSVLLSGPLDFGHAGQVTQ